MYDLNYNMEHFEIYGDYEDEVRQWEIDWANYVADMATDPYRN